MLTALLAQEIASRGPISFREFQETALYHPQHGYYRREQNPFGVRGDFYTAEQLQPVFGLLMARAMDQLLARIAPTGPFSVVELGAGREEMRPYLQQWNYHAVESGRGELPSRIRGVVFGNEFLDALPIHTARKRGSLFHEVMVGYNEVEFRFVEGGAVDGDLGNYLSKHAAHVPDGTLVEAHLDAIHWLDKLDKSFEAGFLLFIDYGFTERERVRFPNGTLMSYSRHQADEDVLKTPGGRDITSHVPFTIIIEEAKQRGFQLELLQTLAQLLLNVGEKDNFHEVLEGKSELEVLRRRGQLKTLLYGMGETFRVLLFSRGLEEPSK